MKYGSSHLKLYRVLHFQGLSMVICDEIKVGVITSDSNE